MKLHFLKLYAIAGGLLFSLPVQAATSAMNNNIRLVEDATWATTFTLMIIAGILMKRLATVGSAAYGIFILAGFLGLGWKTIGLIKRIFAANDPVWFFSILRETLEGFTGVVLAIAFIMLAFSLRQLFSD